MISRMPSLNLPVCPFQKCIFCEGNAASIKCHIKSCSRRFHFKCAFDSEKCSLKFHEHYHAMCPSHTIRCRRKPKNDEPCIICLMELGPATICGQINLDCRPHMWMHRSCAIQLADSRGYAFQCPVCGESKKFQKYIRLRGVFIPQRDTLTQAHNMAYQESQTRYCEAEICFKCPSREKIVQDKMLTEKVESVKCEYCGKSFHSECGAKQGIFKESSGQKKELRSFTCSSCMNLSDHDLSVSTATEADELNRGFNYGSDCSSSDKEDHYESDSEVTKRFKFDNHYEWKPCRGYHNQEWRQFKLNLFMNTLRPIKDSGNLAEK